MDLCMHIFTQEGIVASVSQTIAQLCRSYIMLLTALRSSERGWTQGHSEAASKPWSEVWVQHFPFHCFVSQKKHDSSTTLPPLSLTLSSTNQILLMAMVRRFRSCSSCMLKNISNDWKAGRRWKCRSAVPEWLLGTLNKTQGEDGDVSQGMMKEVRDVDASLVGGVFV